jgi:TM2 domain-containing membrane protein YozV
MLWAIVSALASFIVPGLGQLLNRKYKRGIGFMALWLVTTALVSVIALPFFMLVHLVFIIATAIDAYRIVTSAETIA